MKPETKEYLLGELEKIKPLIMEAAKEHTNDNVAHVLFPVSIDGVTDFVKYDKSKKEITEITFFMEDDNGKQYTETIKL